MKSKYTRLKHLVWFWAVTTAILSQIHPDVDWVTRLLGLLVAIGTYHSIVDLFVAAREAVRGR